MKNIQAYTLSNKNHSYLIRPESGLNQFVETSKTMKLEKNNDHPAGAQVPQLAGRIFMSCTIPLFTWLGILHNLTNASWKGALLIGMTLTGREIKNITKEQLAKDINQHLTLLSVDYATMQLFYLSLPVVLGTYLAAPEFFRKCSDKLHQKVFSILDNTNKDSAKSLGILVDIPQAFGTVYNNN